VEIDIIEFWSYNEGAAVIRGAPLFVFTVIRDGSMWPLAVITGGRHGGYKKANNPNLQRWQFDRAL
jgi:hypothetical protein